MALVSDEWRKHFQYFFLVGLPESDENLKDQMIKEQHQYQDIVNYEGFKSYANLTSKVTWGFQYVIDHYNSQFDVLLKTDDDAYINIPAILRFLRDTDLTSHYYGYMPHKMMRLTECITDQI